MAADDTTETDVDVDEAALARALDENADELAALLDLLAVTEGLATDLAPELRTAVRENREPVAALREAFENEDAFRLLTRVGEEADTLVELLDVLAVSHDLADDLLPEVKVAIRENRDVMARARVALENEDTLVLLERVGANADTLADLLDLLDATTDLADDLVPELRTVARENRDVVREFRMVAAGFADAQAERDTDAYELGRNAGNAVALLETVGDPQVTRAIDATVDGLTAPDPEPVGPLGVIRALFDPDVRRAIGRLVAAARGLGAVDIEDAD